MIILKMHGGVQDCFAALCIEITNRDLSQNLLNDVDYHWDTVQAKCPDTYSFLKSLQNRLSTFSQY